MSGTVLGPGDRTEKQTDHKTILPALTELTCSRTEGRLTITNKQICLVCQMVSSATKGKKHETGPVSVGIGYGCNFKKWGQEKPPWKGGIWANSQEKAKNESCVYLGDGYNRKGEEQVQMPWDRNVSGALGEQKGSQCLGAEWLRGEQWEMGAEKAQVLGHVGLMAIVRTPASILNDMVIIAESRAEK